MLTNCGKECIDIDDRSSLYCTMVRAFLQKNRIRVAVIVSCAYLLLIIFYYHIDRYLAGIPFIAASLLIIVTFVIAAIGSFVGTLKMIFIPTERNYRIATAIYALAMVYTVLPFHVSSAPSDRNVVLRACFEGTQNQATLKFYKDHHFELHWTGVFGYSEYFTGTYKPAGDTFFLNYETMEPYRFGETILNKDSLLTPLDPNLDTDQVRVSFYLGYCKHLN